MINVDHDEPALDFDSPEHQAALSKLYRDFAEVSMTPLWQVRGNLQPFSPQSRAVSLALVRGPGSGQAHDAEADDHTAPQSHSIARAVVEPGCTDRNWLQR